MKENKINNVKNRVQCNTIEKIAKAMSGETRIRILCLIAKQELNVGEIAEALNLTQSTTSLSLEKLLNEKLVTRKRKGKFVYYSTNKKRIEEFLRLITQTFLK